MMNDRKMLHLDLISLVVRTPPRTLGKTLLFDFALDYHSFHEAELITCHTRLLDNIHRSFTNRDHKSAPYLKFLKQILLTFS